MSEFEWVDIDNFIFPNPKERIDNPRETVLQKGDLVMVKIGPAIGKLGIVVIERNGNYKDCYYEVGEDAIGVGVAEENIVAEDFKKMLKDLAPKIRTITRWFDGPDQLELLASANQK